MIDRDHDLPVKRQAGLVGISRGSVYTLPRPVSDADLRLMRCIDELHLEVPFICCGWKASSWAASMSSR